MSSFTAKYILYLSSKTEPSIKMEINRYQTRSTKSQRDDKIDITKIKTSEDILDLLSILKIDVNKYWLFEVQKLTYEDKVVKGLNRSDVVSKSILFRTRLDEYCFSLIDASFKEYSLKN